MTRSSADGSDSGGASPGRRVHVPECLVLRSCLYKSIGLCALDLVEPLLLVCEPREQPPAGPALTALPGSSPTTLCRLVRGTSTTRRAPPIGDPRWPRRAPASGEREAANADEYCHGRATMASAASVSATPCRRCSLQGGCWLDGPPRTATPYNVSNSDLDREGREKLRYSWQGKRQREVPGWITQD
jgi:hypothetical protein